MWNGCPKALSPASELWDDASSSRRGEKVVPPNDTCLLLERLEFVHSCSLPSSNFGDERTGIVHEGRRSGLRNVTPDGLFAAAAGLRVGVKLREPATFTTSLRRALEARLSGDDVLSSSLDESRDPTRGGLGVRLFAGLANAKP